MMHLVRNILIILSFTLVLVSCRNATEEKHIGHTMEKVQYTCPMHPQIIKDAPGKCPICGMDLVKKETVAARHTDITLGTLLQPTNEYVVSTIPVTTALYRNEPMEIEAVGYTAYNTASVGIISSRVTGRIERLFVKYRYQPVTKGQRIMDIYSPELQTAQENLLFILKYDAANENLINAARQKLLLLGMSKNQLAHIIAAGRPEPTVSVYSSYSGHIHEASDKEQMQTPGMAPMNETVSQSTKELNIKEGMYIQRGQTVFSVYNPKYLWGLLSIYPSDQPYIKVNNEVLLIPDGNQDKSFKSKVAYVEPVLRSGTKTITARVTIDNNSEQIKVGSQLKAKIIAGPHSGWWLPNEAVLSLGINKIVFVKKGAGFVVQKVTTGHKHPKWIQVVDGLSANDSVAMNAQYLMDSESFIRINGQ